MSTGTVAPLAELQRQICIDALLKEVEGLEGFGTDNACFGGDDTHFCRSVGVLAHAKNLPAPNDWVEANVNTDGASIFVYAGWPDGECCWVTRPDYKNIRKVKE